MCDDCRKTGGKYDLVTKTVARDEYLLTDADLDPQYGGLRYIEKKNPHHETWGMMKLFLRCQVERVCYDRYGGEPGLEKEIERRYVEKTKRQEKQQKTKIAKMRKQTYTSLWRKEEDTHEHVYGPEEDCGDGTWKKACTKCSQQVTFEKM